MNETCEGVRLAILENGPSEEARAHAKACRDCESFLLAETRIREGLSLPPPTPEALAALSKLRAPALPGPRRVPVFSIPAAAMAGAAFTFLVLSARPLPPRAAEVAASAADDGASGLVFAEADDDLDSLDAEDFDLLDAEVSWSADPDVEVDP